MLYFFHRCSTISFFRFVNLIDISSYSTSFFEFVNFIYLSFSLCVFLCCVNYFGLFKRKNCVYFDEASTSLHGSRSKQSGALSLFATSRSQKHWIKESKNKGTKLLGLLY